MKMKFRIAYVQEILKEKALFFSVFIGLMVFGYLQMPSLNINSSTIVQGEVISLRGAEGDGVRLFLNVKLDSGENVFVLIPNTGAYYKKGHRLSMQKRRTSFFGGSEYIFNEYVSKNKI